MNRTNIIYELNKNSIRNELKLSQNNNYSISEMDAYEKAYCILLDLIECSNTIELDVYAHNKGINDCIAILKDFNIL